MGLDTYAVMVKEDGEFEFADPALFKDVGSLCGGIFSGNGNDGSFRGKVYDQVVEEATGETLYQELIPPETVARMSEAFDGWLAAHPYDYEGEYDITIAELQALADFLRVCKEHGLGLHGWW